MAPTLSIACLDCRQRIGRSRGLCWQCHKRLSRAVKAGATIWEALEAAGRAKPPQPQPGRRKGRGA